MYDSAYAIYDKCNELVSDHPTSDSFNQLFFVFVFIFRLGEVPTREASVVIAISSPHRRDSLEAVAHCIEKLKATVTVWKKEVYEGESAVWKENKECAWSSNKP